MTKRKIILIGLVILLLAIIGIYISFHNQNESLPEPTTFIFNKELIIEEQTINESGAEILIKKPNTPIDGIKIVFPTGTVSDDTKVEVGYYEGEWKLSKGVNNKFTLPLILILDKKLNTDGQPIEIYKKSDMAFQVDNTTGRLEVMNTVNDITYTFRQKNIITFTDFD